LSTYLSFVFFRLFHSTFSSLMLQ